MVIDFLVVGGGIGGAVLAELLGRAGKKVVVLEKGTGPPKWIRPEVLWPATAEKLFSLLPRENWEREALLPLQGIQIHDGRRTFPLLSPELLRETKIQPWSTDPNQTREQLLRLGTFELRRGEEVTAVLKEKNRIVGVRSRNVATNKDSELVACWTVGDDGVHSVVRQACGIPMRTRLFPFDFLCFGFDWPSTLPKATGRAWLSREGSRSGIFALVALPLPQGRGAGLVLTRPKVFEVTAPVEAAWNRFCAADAIIQDVIGDREFPQGFVRVRRPWGHARRYGIEGAILMGDAAHPVSPAGGQGANMSVADACALAELACGNGSCLLEDYERRRRPANERSVNITRRAAMLFGLPTWCSPLPMLQLVLRWAGRHPPLLRRLLRFSSAAFQEEQSKRS